MNTRIDMRRLAACGLLIAAVGPLSTMSSVSAEASGSVTTAPALKADPPGTTYVYSATFEAVVTHKLFVNWGGQSKDERTVSATIRGTVPRVFMDENGYLRSLGDPGDTVSVVTAEGTSVARVAETGYVKSCSGASGSVTGPPLVSADPNTDWNHVMPFALLSVPVKCTDSRGASETMTYQYGPLIALAGTNYDPGTRSLSLDMTVAKGVAPLTEPEVCPGYIPDQTPTCSYAIKGFVNLRLIETNVPAKDDPNPPKDNPTPPKPPKGAVLSPDLKKVTAPVKCPKKCAVTATPFGLEGGPKLTAPRTIRLRPGRTAQLSVAIPASKRALVEKAGGVRVKLTYKLAGGKTYSEVRKARL